MGYFSNGSEGADYEARYCRRCIHYGPENGPGCAIWGIHLAWNYDACEDESLRKVMDSLIPRTPEGWNRQCVMFLPATEAPHTPSGVEV